MAKRVRSKEEIDRATKNAREKRERWKRAATDRGVDATRISRFSLEQQIELYNLVGETTVNDHGLPDKFEAFWCHETTRSLTDKGYPQPVKLHPNFTGGDDDNRECRPDTPFICGTVILASEGCYATDKELDCSHLCGNRACLRPSHLRFETRLDNNRRNFCSGFVFCSCCDELTSACWHTPKCIKIKMGTNL